MIDKLRFQEFLAKYKENFVNFNWKKEKYKWEAIKCFRDNWDDYGLPGTQSSSFWRDCRIRNSNKDMPPETCSSSRKPKMTV